jgi:asparagine synthase (glutamine-hydrolysing)
MGSLLRGFAAVTTADPVVRQLAMSRVVGPEQRGRLFSDAFRQPGAEAEIAGAVLGRLDPRAGSTLSQVLDLDRKLALVDLMFLYFDKMSMAASLEVRVPFMDHDVVSFCTALSDDRKVWRGRRKEILKRVSAGLVDEDVIKKPKRAFFVGALGPWLEAHREDLFREVLLDRRTLDRGYFRPEPVEALVAGAGTDGKQPSRQLLSLLLLEKWHRMFVDGDGRARRLALAAQA